MRHIKTISKRPQTAQLEEISLIIGVIQGIIGIFSNGIRLLQDAANAFGFDIPQKNGMN